MVAFAFKLFTFVLCCLIFLVCVHALLFLMLFEFWNFCTLIVFFWSRIFLTGVTVVILFWYYDFIYRYVKQAMSATGGALSLCCRDAYTVVTFSSPQLFCFRGTIMPSWLCGQRCSICLFQAPDFSTKCRPTTWSTLSGKPGGSNNKPFCVRSKGRNWWF